MGVGNCRGGIFGVVRVYAMVSPISSPSTFAIGNNVARYGLVYLCGVLPLHFQQVTDAECLPVAEIHNVVVVLQLPRQHAHEAEGA